LSAKISGNQQEGQKEMKIGYLLLFMSLSACSLSGSQDRSYTGQPKAETVAVNQQPKEQKEGLKQVEAKYVCMINNQVFQKEQIPIKVGKQTYYGCCDMCKERLGKDPKSRVAVDPVSKKEVDKSKAVIGADAEGTVYYFENAENLNRYSAR
jgi:YHS domain-containing protein